MSSIDTRRTYTWQPPGWPTQLTVHFSAPVVGSGQGTNGTAQVQARKGGDMNAQSLTTVIPPLDEINQTFAFADTVHNGGGFTGDIYHTASSTGSYATASTTAVIVK
jgi:hypothetical protein